MKKKIKLICSVMVSVMFLAVFVGCSQTTTTQQEETTTEAAASSDEPIELRFSWWGSDSRHQATLDVIDLYMSRNPNVVISAEYGSNEGYEDRLMLQLASGTAPDIIQVDSPTVPTIVGQFDCLVDLSTQDIDTSNFDQDFLADHGYVNGTLYALPTGLNGTVILLNTAICDAAGVDYSYEWTWEDLITEGKKVHEYNPDWYMFNTDQGEFGVYVLKTYIKQLTGEQLVNDDYTLGFTETEAAEALGYIVRLFDEGVNEPASESFLYPWAYFENPKWVNNEIGACYSHASTVIARKDGFADTAEVVAMPIMENAKESGHIVRPSQTLVINKDSKHVEEAAKFLDFFFNDEEAALILKDCRSVPPTTTAQQLLLDNDLVDPLVLKAVDISMAHAGNKQNTVSGQTALETVMSDAIEQAVMNHDPEGAAAYMVEQFNLTLVDIKKTLGD